MFELVIGSVASIVPLFGALDCCFAGNSRGYVDSRKFYDWHFWGYRVDVKPFVILCPWPSAWQPASTTHNQATDLQPPCLFTTWKDSLTDVRFLFFSRENRSKAGKMINCKSKELIKVFMASRWQPHSMLLWFLMPCCLSLNLTLMFAFYKVCVFINFKNSG